MRSILLSCLIISLLSLANLAKGFDLKAHEAISRRAIQSQISSIDNFLKGELSQEFPNGIEQSINSKTVRRWIEEGSQSEDSPLPRVLAHFHNPGRSWGTAGLGLIFESAVLWVQNRAQRPGGNHSWHYARESYYKALTGRTNVERDQDWAETFETLGHLIHLVQDLATPAHTRNDPHLVEDGFHTWAEKESSRAIISGMSSKPFDPSILGLDPNPLALVPIARIMDTERYAQTGIPEAGDNIGIAEYSNANFFSDDTIFSVDFPFPNEDSVELGAPETEPKTGELRRYFKKVRDGETMDHFAVPSALYDALRDALADQEKGLDDTVFQDYANLLIPRAIGYSAGLIDYFFRGRIEIEGPPEGLRGTHVRVKVRNVTPDEESGNGRIVAVVQVEENGETFISTSLPQTVNLTRDFQEVVFDFSSNPMRGAPEHFLTVVYDGPLGLEEEAVMVGGRTIVRPRIARICDGRNGRRGCPITWLIPSPGATLTIEARGVTNNGRIIAQGTDPDGACLDFNCTTDFPVSFTSLGTQSFTAPITNGTTLSYFFMQILAEAGGFVCIFDTEGTPQGAILWDSFNWTGGMCPQ